MTIHKGGYMENDVQQSKQVNEILRNITLTSEDVVDDKLTEKFYNRTDVSDIKKSLLKKLLGK
jgi:hypothetical protein